jgi:hypothetical protein
MRSAVVPFGYPRRVAIVACPFCREMFERTEAKHCPVCGIALQALEKLPPAPTLAHELEDDGIPPAPEHVPFPATFLGRGRGAIVALGVLGILLFFMTWIHVTLPYIVELSGFDLARRQGFSWAGGVAWVVLVPTIASRRTIAQLRGARFAAAFLSFVPAFTATIIAVFTPPHGILPVRFTYGWALWATIALSLVATAVSARLGGRLDVMTVSTGSSVGHALH